ncbi:glycosyltransferase family 4 protein [Sharpea azabuensis]|uniref:glycosyltransferase family 4 protein n=1 Tax=Sharpea azabuensis TaxID=322505 RepID=UPI0013DB5F2D|nr:glycosyltransferase family 4 protein [Sharpea azabuensis]
MKRILYITNLPAPYKIDFFQELCKYEDLTVIYERSKAENRNEMWYKKTTNSFHEIYLNGIKIGEENSFDTRICSYLRALKYDFVIVNGYSSFTEMIAILYMKIHKIKFAIMCDGILVKNNSFIKRKVKRLLISSARFWLSSGSLTDQALLECGACKDRIYHYPFTSIKKSELCTKHYNNAAYKLKIKCHSKYMILYVGQMIYRKGIDVLIRAIDYIDLDIQLYLVGGSINKNISDKRIKNVKFLKSNELKDFYKAADVLVLPSREDTWGLVINEALCCGTPVIATDQCGAAIEMIEKNKNGDIVPAGRADLLGKAIKKILLAPNYEEYIRLSLETAKKYTIEKMAKSVSEAIKKYV